MPKPTTIFIEILRNFDDAQNCYIKVKLQVKLVCNCREICWLISTV